MHIRLASSLGLIIGIAFCACTGQGQAGEHQVRAAPDVKWGIEQSGLRFRIWTVAAAFGHSEAIPLHYAVQNISKVPRDVWHAFFWSNHRVTVTAPDGRPVNLTRAGEIARKAAKDGMQEKTYPFSLPPGAKDLNWPITNLRDYFVFDAEGRYLVRCI